MAVVAASVALEALGVRRKAPAPRRGEPTHKRELLRDVVRILSLRLPEGSGITPTAAHRHRQRRRRRSVAGMGL